MKKKSSPQFDPDALMATAGDKVVARGMDYFLAGAVEIIATEKTRVVARVAGTQDYRTVVCGEDEAIGGECSCPAFERDAVCEHMVAVALAANAALVSGKGVVAGPLAEIRSYLAKKPVEALVEMIVDLAESDAALMRKLEVAAAASGDDPKTFVKRMRQAIDTATRARNFVDYRQVPGWAAGVDAALDGLADAASGPHAAAVIELADHAIETIEAAIAMIDDSDGHGSALLAHAQEIHLQACKAARPEPKALARLLFLRETEGEYDPLTGAAAIYEDVLGDEGLAEYRRLANEAFDALPPRRGRSGERPSFSVEAWRLTSILDFFAERDGDLEQRIALRAKDVESQWHYLQLAEFCRDNGLDERALGYAEEGLWLFEDDRPDERLVFFTVDLSLSLGRKKPAKAHLWRAFEKDPSIALYDRLRELGGKDAGLRAVDHLMTRLEGARSTRWHFPADLVVRVMVAERMFDEAWKVIRDHGASRGAQETLARASETSHPQEALAVFEEGVEQLAQAGGNPAYEEAAALIARMRPLHKATEHAAYLEALKARHGRKRNLMRLLG